MDFEKEYREIKEAIGEQEEKIRQYKQKLRRVEKIIKEGGTANLSIKELYEKLSDEGFL